MLSGLARRAALLTAALGFSRLRRHEPVPPAVALLATVDRLTRGLQPVRPVRSTSPLGAAHRVGVLAALAREALRRVVWVTPGGEDDTMTDTERCRWAQGESSQ